MASDRLIGGAPKLGKNGRIDTKIVGGPFKKHKNARLFNNLASITFASAVTSFQDIGYAAYAYYDPKQVGRHFLRRGNLGLLVSTGITAAALYHTVLTHEHFQDKFNQGSLFNNYHYMVRPYGGEHLRHDIRN